jgi:hypothetical protein
MKGVEYKKLDAPRSFLPFNPTMSRLNGDLVLNIRLFTRAKNTENWIGRDGDSKSFKMLQDDSLWNLEGVVRHRRFNGLEDIRLFQFKGKLRFIASTRNLSSTMDFSLVLGTLTSSLCIERLVELSYDKRRANEKNWLPFVSNGRLFCMYDAMTVLAMNPDTGVCVLHSKFSYPPAIRKFRGSAMPQLHPNGMHYCIMHTLNKHLLVLHFYTHYLVELDSRKGFRISRVFKPLRLRAGWVEFVSDFLIERDSVCIGWGDRDRVAMLSKVHIDAFTAYIDDQDNTYLTL